MTRRHQLKTLSLCLVGLLSFMGISQEIQSYNSGRLLPKGKHDLTLFNSLYTEDQGNFNGAEYGGFRQTFASNWFQFTWGVSKNGRFNIGGDLTIRNTGRSTTASYRGIANAYQYTNTDSTRFGLSSVGLRIRWQPFASVTDFTIQSTLSAPTIRHPEGLNSNNLDERLFWADWNRIVSWTQFFYTKDFKRSQLFTEIDWLYRFPVLSTHYGHVDVPVTVIYSYFFNSKWTGYGIVQHVNRFTNNQEPNNSNLTDFVIPAAYTQVGAGIKYAWNPKWQLELLYNRFVYAKNSGLGESLNLGIRTIF